jgi:hypothetical protein
MPIAPLVNAGTTPQVRRPRPTLGESVAVSGPFALLLYCTEAGKHRPAPNNVSVASGRVAITPTPTTDPAYLAGAWGVDYAYDGPIDEWGAQVGYLWIRSIDADGDGYDDLESAGSVTLAGALGLDSDGIVDSAASNSVRGTGSLSLTGSGTLTMRDPLAGIGAIAFTGAGVLGVVAPLAGVGALTLDGAGTLTASASQQSVAGTGSIALSASGRLGIIAPIAGIGSLALTGSGILKMKNALAGTGSVSLSGSGALTASAPAVTYYPHSGGLLDTAAPSGGELLAELIDPANGIISVRAGASGSWLAFSTLTHDDTEVALAESRALDVSVPSGATSISFKLSTDATVYTYTLASGTLHAGTSNCHVTIYAYWGTQPDGEEGTVETLQLLTIPGEVIISAAVS